MPLVFTLSAFNRLPSYPDDVHRVCGEDDDERADEVVPEERDVGEEEAVEHDELARERAEEGGGAADAFEVEAEQEYAEQRAVEERAEAVDGLDERAELARVLREGYREAAPHDGRELRGEEVVTLARVALQKTALNVHDGRRRKRAPLP